MRQSGSQLPEGLADRGIGWQAAGFALTGMACVLVMQVFAGSGFWLFEWFKTATTDLYWSFIVPLAWLFDGGRKLFEKGKAIREAQKARMVNKARRDEQKRIQKELERAGVTLAPEVVQRVFGDDSDAGS